MNKNIDFYFDFSSSYAYLAQHRIQQLAEELELDINWKPFALGAIFKALGHAPPKPESTKGRYIWKDVERGAAEMNLPFHWPDPFPFNSIPAARMFYALQATQSPERAIEWAQAVFKSSYGQGLDCSDPGVLMKLAEQLGHPGEELLAASQQEEVKSQLKEVTGEADALGVFGSPTFFLDGEMFWGADRIDLIERRITTARSA